MYGKLLPSPPALDCSNRTFGNITADLCSTYSVTLTHQSVAQDVPLYLQDCGIKSRCTEFKNRICGDLATNLNGTDTQIKNCDAVCCQSDLCNNPPDPSVTTVTTGPTTGTTAGTTTESSGISITPTSAIFGILGLMTVAFMN